MSRNTVLPASVEWSQRKPCAVTFGTPATGAFDLDSSSEALDSRFGQEDIRQNTREGQEARLMDYSKFLDLAWPLIAAIGLFKFRKQIDRLLNALHDAIGKGRTLKFGVAGVSIELGAAIVEREDRVSKVTDMPFAAEPAMFASSGREYIEALIHGPSVEAITIDLRSSAGDGFITSRLFLTSRMMARQRDARVVAFVNTDGVREGVYLGACTIDDLDRALVRRFPEYEAAYAMAFHQGWWNRHQPTVVQSPGRWPAPPHLEITRPQLEARGRLPTEDATRVIGAFLEAMQSTPAGPPSNGVPPCWVWIPNAQVFERAEWVSKDWLRKQVGAAFIEDRVTKTPDVMERILAGRGPYVGLVDAEDNLVELISRTRVLEQLAQAEHNR